MKVRDAVLVGVTSFCVAACVFTVAPRRIEAEMPGVSGATSRWQIANARRVTDSLDPHQGGGDGSTAILLDTQTGDTWQMDLGQRGYYWRRMERR